MHFSLINNTFWLFRTVIEKNYINKVNNFACLFFIYTYNPSTRSTLLHSFILNDPINQPSLYLKVPSKNPLIGK